MNYITNYYKNLSEQLQAQVNHLEREVRMINEAIAAGTMAPGAQSFAQAGRPEATNPGYDPQMLAALLAAYGQNSSQFDYNRDGVVDGADLGILLGGQAGGNPLTQRSTQVSTGNPATPAGSLGQGQFVSGAGMRRPTQAGGGRFNPTASIGGANAFANAGRPTQAGGGRFNPNASMGGANAFANAGRPTQGGGSQFTGDLNGDGVVDGADLGLALGGQAGGNYQGVLQNWGMQTSANQYVPTTTQQRRPRRTVR
jgi:hypothetical protein